MADQIKRYIYHEKQEKGSMLCAQHALNAVLQGPYYTATDLASIARELDELESAYRTEDRNAPSHTQSVNMDDSGFFSGQVVDRALRVWGLTIAPWRSEALAQFHNDPDTQQAFVLNLEQHWFSIRRFGHPGGNGHWFNLNSFYDAPERVGKMYLGMVLQQAEMEGYSVFAVRPAEAEGTERNPEAVPYCEADEIAATIPESAVANTSGPSSSSNRPGGSQNPAHGLGTDDADAAAIAAASFEDEDEELQRALEASLQHSSGGTGAAPATTSSYSQPQPPSRSQTQSRGLGGGGFASTLDPFATGSSTPLDFSMGGASASEHHDSVAASTARSQALLERTLQEQRMAEEEGGFRFGSGAGRRGGTTGDEDEEEEMRRAIEESLAMHGGEGQAQAPARGGRDEDEDDDDYIPEDDGDFDPDESYIPQRTRRQAQAQSRGAAPPVPVSTRPSNAGASASIPQPQAPGSGANRVFDDEDAELQAALKASLEGLPEGFVIPPTPPRQPLVHTSRGGSASGSGAGGFGTPRTPAMGGPMREAPPLERRGAGAMNRADDDDDDEEEEEEEVKSPDVENLDVDEMRKRRLARFGA
ncbi:Josephin-domain-containing protein [Clavulina sp. PMI_390]|nr:Josephin-domain-containing protein [Clavulina sp. PMI_390]